MTVLNTHVASAPPNCDQSYSPWQLSLPTCNHILMRGYLICSSRFSATSPSCGPFGVRAGGRGCQFCRDALGAPLPPRAHRASAQPAAILHIRHTLVGCHCHLQGCGSLSKNINISTHTTELGFQAALHAQVHLFMPLKTERRQKKKWMDTHGHTPNEQKHHSEPIQGTPQSLQTCWIY